MRIIIDTELERVIVPNSFYSQIDKMNKLLSENGGKKVEYEGYVKNATEKALANPYLRKDDLKTFKR